MNQKKSVDDANVGFKEQSNPVTHRDPSIAMFTHSCHWQAATLGRTIIARSIPNSVNRCRVGLTPRPHPGLIQASPGRDGQAVFRPLPVPSHRSSYLELSSSSLSIRCVEYWRQCILFSRFGGQSSFPR